MGGALVQAVRLAVPPALAAAVAIALRPAVPGAGVLRLPNASPGDEGVTEGRADLAAVDVRNGGLDAVEELHATLEFAGLAIAPVDQAPQVVEIRREGTGDYRTAGSGVFVGPRPWLEGVAEQRDIRRAGVEPSWFCFVWQSKQGLLQMS